MITKELLKAIRVDLNAALATVAAKHRLSITCGNCTFNANDATMKLAINTIESGEVITKEMGYLRRNLGLIGLREEHLTQVFSLSGHRFTVSGYNARASAKPFLITRVDDGKTYIASVDAIFKALGVNRWDNVPRAVPTTGLLAGHRIGAPLLGVVADEEAGAPGRAAVTAFMAGK